MRRYLPLNELLSWERNIQIQKCLALVNIRSDDLVTRFEKKEITISLRRHFSAVLWKTSSAEQLCNNDSISYINGLLGCVSVMLAHHSAIHEVYELVDDLNSVFDVFRSAH